jgi:hypothetical protein
VLRVCGKGHQDRPDPAAASGRAGDRPRDRRPYEWTAPAQQPRRPDGPSRGHPPPAAARRCRRGADQQAASAHASPYLRHHHAGRGRGPAGRPDRCPSRRPPHYDALRPGPQEPRPAPELPIRSASGSGRSGPRSRLGQAHHFRLCPGR